MTSNFQKKTEAEVEVALNQLVPQVTGFFVNNFLRPIRQANKTT